MTMYLRRRAGFSAGLSHPPPGDTGRGHDYLCELTVGGEIAPDTGMVINIRDVDAVLKAQVVGPLHGKLLDKEVPEFGVVGAFEVIPFKGEPALEGVFPSCHWFGPGPIS